MLMDMKQVNILITKKTTNFSQIVINYTQKHYLELNTVQNLHIETI